MSLVLNSEATEFLIKREEEGARKEFTIFHRFAFSFRAGIIVFCIASIIGAVVQSVSLPLFLSTLPTTPGFPAYFVIWICSFVFTIIFGAGAVFLIYQGAVTPEMRAWKWHKYMFFVGMFDSMNGVLVVFSAFLSRVPGPLGPILSNSSILFTLLFSKFLLRKVYAPKQFIGAFLVFVGIAVSLVPTFLGIFHHGTGKAAAWWWPLVALLGYIPAALMNVVQELMQDTYRKETTSNDKRFSVIYFQAVESFYQFLWMCFFFWTDLIPKFGLSPDINTFWETFVGDWQCFLGINLEGRCAHAGEFGVLFMISYLCVYAFGTELTMYASANMLSVVSTVSPLLATIFWFAFPSVNAWAGGSPLSYLDLAFNLGAFPFLILGIILYRIFEVEDKTPQGEELQHGVELCW